MRDREFQRVDGGCSYDQSVVESFTKKVPYEQTPKGDESTSHVGKEYSLEETASTKILRQKYPNHMAEWQCQCGFSVTSDIRLVGVLPVTVLDLTPVFGMQESGVHHPILETLVQESDSQSFFCLDTPEKYVPVSNLIHRH